MSRLTKITNWRSTLAGLAMILSALARVHALADVTKADVYGELAGGVGLILCADAKKDADSSDAARPQ